MKQTIDDGLSNPSSISSDEMAVEADFLAGKSAFAVNWLFQYADSNDASKSQIVGKVAFAPMPVFEAGAAAGVKGSSVDGSSSLPSWQSHPLLRSDLEVSHLSGKQPRCKPSIPPRCSPSGKWISREKH